MVVKYLKICNFSHYLCDFFIFSDEIKKKWNNTASEDRKKIKFMVLFISRNFVTELS